MPKRGRINCRICCLCLYDVVGQCTHNSVVVSVILHLFLKLFSAGCFLTNKVFCEGMSKGEIEGIRIVGNPCILQNTLRQRYLIKNKWSYYSSWFQVKHASAYHCFSQRIAASLAILVLSHSSVRFELKEFVILV